MTADQLPQAYVLMTAMPPTYGHLDLIQFASNLSVRHVHVILNTQPGEPFPNERQQALEDAIEKLDRAHRITLHRIHRPLPQEPEGQEGFWDMWVGFLTERGFESGDFIVASEKYGVKLAEEADGQFMPYDLDRWVRWTKGTAVRNDYVGYWDQMIPEFRRYLQKKVTIFGAESTGKTTLTQALVADSFFGVSTKLFEWARPFLEQTGPDVTVEGMYRIWEGQRALQISTYENALHPLVIQDTDLYTTVGFWEDWDPASMPPGILFDARMTKSDLYIITRSNIPFEHDILRFGGDERQTPDEFWIDLCERYDLNYVVLDADDLKVRMIEASDYISELLENPLTYQREGAEYRS